MPPIRNDGSQSSGVKDPGQHGCRRGLAVSSGDDQHFLAAQEFVVQQLRQRAERNALVEHVFEFDIAAGHGIADHDQIGPGFEILGVERLRHGNAEVAQENRTSADRRRRRSQ